MATTLDACARREHANDAIHVKTNCAVTIPTRLTKLYSSIPTTTTTRHLVVLHPVLCVHQGLLRVAQPLLRTGQLGGKVLGLGCGCSQVSRGAVPGRLRSTQPILMKPHKQQTTDGRTGNNDTAHYQVDTLRKEAAFEGDTSHVQQPRSSHKA